jgi:hypothetical protein
MSHRLQVLIPEELDARIRKAAQRSRVSKGHWVRRAIEEGLRRPAGQGQQVSEPLARLASLAAPTADIQQMITEVESGRA